MSKTTLIVISTFSAIIGGLIVGFIMLTSVGRSGTIFNTGPETYVPGTGYKMLTEFQCIYGEEKHIIMRGVDDGFVLGNKEPTRRIPDIEDYPGYSANNPYLRAYDDVGPDMIFSDFLAIPPNVSSGLFIIRLEAKTNYGNDVLSIGDLSDISDDYYPERHHTFNSGLKELFNTPGWQVSPEHILSARLKDIRFSYLPSQEKDLHHQRAHKTLLSYARAMRNEGLFSVLIHDDTGVDYVGAVFCTEPREKLGLTFSSFRPLDKLGTDLQLFACELDYKSQHCNPFIGDTLCSSARPLACFKDTGSPVPRSIVDLPKTIQPYIQLHWGAGEVEFTPPVRGDALATLREANEVCVRNFGETWRVLDFHDGGLKGVSSRRSSNAPNDRVWVDIKDQPRGTCWARSEADLMDKAGLE